MKINKYDKMVLKIVILQIISLLIICFSSIYMTSKKLYIEELILIAIYFFMLYGITQLRKKWLKKYVIDHKEELKNK